MMEMNIRRLINLPKPLQLLRRECVKSLITHKKLVTSKLILCINILLLAFSLSRPVKISSSYVRCPDLTVHKNNFLY